ncbi:MAG: 50S ribosomal protein L29 [Bacteroidales bacterium]|jgi:large subunit ribosomal protein L29|nr:50S ribosomal protein L29 [Lachnospiraceae bacterium]MBO7572985.1 50S ribosomal protein L29 [Bacteroidales bacterium]MBQ4035045.1 50S ribosomal protein L29 [Paludibacteraceae bacterium]MBQ1695015.1 50S ribosomal protein L29 [Bacteroidales bacterium]MBQ1731501.1 50S ribosomal protein L29 [Bacteroidales bacterium]
MENKEIVGLTTKEIVEKIATEKFNLNKMRLNHAVSPLENPQRLKEVRRTIARLNTELRKRELTSNK